MTSADFDLEGLLNDARDLVEESLVARALLQPDINPWESFPLDLLYPAEEPFNEIHFSSFCDSPADSLPVAEPTIKTEPINEAPFGQSEPELTASDEVQVFSEYLHFAHDDSDLGYFDTSTTSSPTTTVSSSALPIEAAPFIEPVTHLFSTEQLDYPNTSATPTPISLDSFLAACTSPTTTQAVSDTPIIPSSESVASASPTTTVSPSSPFSLSDPSYTDIESIHIISEDLQHSNVPLDEASDSAKPSAEPEVHYTFVDPHEKPRKRRTKGVKNSTPIACTFCRRRKIRCGGPQESGGVCKSCIRLNHGGECVFPTVSYRGQRLGGLNSKRKSTSESRCTSKGTSTKRVPPSSESR